MHSFGGLWNSRAPENECRCVCWGAEGNIWERSLAFARFLITRFLTPKEELWNLCHVLFLLQSYMYFINRMPNWNSSPVRSLSSSLPLPSVPLFCSLPALVILDPAPLKACEVGSAVPRELSAFLFSSRPSHPSPVECCASFLNDSCPTVPNSPPKHPGVPLGSNITNQHCLKPLERGVPFHLKQDQCLHCCK